MEEGELKMARAFDDERTGGGLNAGFYPCNVVKMELSKYEDKYPVVTYAMDVEFIVEGASYKQNRRWFFDLEFDSTTDRLVKNKGIVKLNIKLDAIGYHGGFNIMGEWEDANGKVLTSLEEINMNLLEHIVTNICDEDKPITFPFICYCYYNKKEGKDRAYFTLYDFATKAGESKFKAHVTDFIKKGKIVNYSNEEQPENKQPQTPVRRTTTRL